MTKTTRKYSMKSVSRLVPLLLLVAGGACKDLQVPNYNAQGLSELQNGANAQGVAAAAVGLLATQRDFETSFLSSYTSVTGAFGRESMELDPSNPAHPVDRYDQIGTLEAGNAGFTTGYRLIKQGNVLLAALASATGLTDQQKEGLRGFTKTTQALALLRLIVPFDQAGLPIDVDIATTAPAAPIASKTAVLARIAQLLDDAQTNLQPGAAGTSFSFTFPAGFVTLTQGPALNTPAQFLKYNRALRARVAAYQATATNDGTVNPSFYTTALTAIAASFMDPAASLRFGAYDTYSNASGDRTNPLYDPTCRQLFAVPQLETGAQTNGATIDLRFSSKIQKIPEKINHTYKVNSCWKLYPSPESPIPIIRNEELILLRAEARWFTGDKTGALQDIDLIRTQAGGLLPAASIGLTTASSDAAFVDELLYNTTYSLMFEGGHRWADYRRFGRLAQLPRDLPRSITATTKVFPYLALPTAECLPRGNPAASCNNPAGT
jgi:hypothetical protein